MTNNSRLKKSEPLVSVIMPVYNCEKYIEQALESVINQTYKNIEIIVVEDASKDGTWDKLVEVAKRDSRIKPLKNKQNLKIVETLNKAIANSKGKYLARMDGDDVRIADSIAKQVSFLEDNPDYAMVGGVVEICDKKMNWLNDRRYPISDAEIRSKMFRFSPFCHASLVFRADALKKSPYRLALAEDYDLYFRIAKVGKMANLEDKVYKVRTHSASDSQTMGRYQEKLTLYIRLKAVFEYGFKMTFSDKVYYALQLGSMFLMPPRFRFWLFNKIRASKNG